MADVIAELLVAEAAIEKLGARGISIDEAQQVPRNANVTVQNPREGTGSKRRLLIGRTDGGRAPTFVIEATIDPSTWLVVTGWEATDGDRKILPS
ncbi:MAG: hypothetical protein ACRDJ2_05915 [Actinomycetota bacterium]